MKLRFVTTAAVLWIAGAVFLSAQTSGREYRYFDSSGVRIAYNAAFASRNDMAAVAAVFRSMADLAVLEEKLRSAHVPCLFIFGTKDDNREEIPLLQKAMSGYSEFADIEGADHGNAVAHPDFLKAVLRFFAQHAVSPRRPE